jgi:hypothetical protein
LISNKQKQRRGSNNSSSSKKSSNKRGKGGVDGDNDVVISPLLAQWAATDMVDSPSTSSSITSFNSITDDDGDDAAVNYHVLDGTTSSQKIDVSLEEINAMLSTNNCNVPNLVANIVSLVNLGSQSSSLSSSKNNDRILLPTLKALLSSKSITRNNSRKQPPPPPQQQQQQQRPPSYRLAWAGSDNAICHIGTSLHKVPLARLQEIYLTLGGDDGKNKWELLEVIRILGPFPNVRNTLRGEVTKLMKLGDGSSTSMGMKRGESSISSSGSTREGVRMEIAYNSMIDGTGKEILASGESRVKYVQLDIWYASAKALVCTTVPSSENGDDADSSNNNIGNKDPLSSSTDGSRILFFVAEENLEEQLEKLRAA